MAAKKSNASEALTKTDSLREQLKRVFAEELPKIPEYLDGMPPTEKMAALIKMMPYIFPQVEKCTMRAGETSGWGDWD